MVYRIEYLLVAAELHLGFRRVDVHIHGGQLCLEMQHTAGEFSHHFLVGVGLLQSGHQQPGFDEPSVDEKELVIPAGPAAGGQRHKAGYLHALPGAAHRHKAQGQLPAQHRVDGGLQFSVTGGQ